MGFGQGRHPIARSISNTTGKPLASRQQCFWKVRAWDRDGADSDWSEPATLVDGTARRFRLVGRYISYRDDTPVFKDRDVAFPAAGAPLSQGVLTQTRRSGGRRSMRRPWASTSST